MLQKRRTILKAGFCQQLPRRQGTMRSVLKDVAAIDGTSVLGGKVLDMNNSLVVLNQPIWKISYSSTLENLPQRFSGVKFQKKNRLSCQKPPRPKIGWNTWHQRHCHHFAKDDLTFEASSSHKADASSRRFFFKPPLRTALA